jgi:hypothetical protein
MVRRIGRQARLALALLLTLMALSSALLVPAAGATAVFHGQPNTGWFYMDEDTGPVGLVSTAGPIQVDGNAGENFAVDVATLNGKITLHSTLNITFCDGTADGTGHVRFKGAKAFVNNALDTLTFTPTPNFNGDTQVGFAIRDNPGDPCANFSDNIESADTLVIHVKPVNDAPVNSVPGTQTIDQGGTVTFSAANGNAITIGDVDEPTAPCPCPYGVTVQTVAPATGTINFVPKGSAVAVPTVDGIGVAGSLADVNASLDGLTYTPGAGTSSTTASPFVLKVTSSDTVALDTDNINVVVRGATAVSSVAGSTTYGSGTGTFMATLKTAGGTALVNKRIDFYLSGTLVGSGTTNASGVATFTGPVTGTAPAGVVAGAVEAKFAGDADYMPSSATGNYTVAKRVLWIKPKNQTRTKYRANAGCLSLNDIELYTPAPAGTGLVNGDTLSTAITGFIAGWGCSYGIVNGSPTHPSAIGTGAITLFGVLSQNYTIAYKTGTLTVTP